MNAELLFKLCRVMDTVVLEKTAGEAFVLISEPCDWLDSICKPLIAGNHSLYPMNGFSFIFNFIEEANDHWGKGNKRPIKSGLWIETDSTGQDCYFEATAITIEGKKLLLIQKDSDEFIEKQRLIQAGRDLALNYHALERAEKQIHACKDELELRVRERTAELEKANAQLAMELEQRKFFEKERDEMIQQIQQSQKMEAIGSLAGGIAHDFNNILSAIIGFTELSISKTQKTSAIGHNLDQVLKAANRARDLVSQILTFSHQAKTERKPTPIKIITKEVVKLLRASLPSTIEIQSTLNSDAYLMADPTQIHQVVMNLCTNAGHSMEENGGLLRVELNDEEISSEDTPFYPDLTAGHYVNLQIADTGQGMTRDVLEQIFNPFFTTKETGKGTGMGLSVVHGIVRSCGGAIHVKSKPGSGTVFRVSLPAIQMDEPAEDLQVEKLVGGNERILFVDDESFQTELASEMLTSLGYTLYTSNDSMDALKKFADNKDSFDLVITDMTMPKKTGKALAREILEIRADMPIILCSGYSENMTTEKAKELGIREYLMKPIGLRDLAKAVRQVLDTQR